MIKLDRVEKYYFRGKPNEIHAIDDVSMVLPDHGIVCLLGPSGCGKTSLLNAIGGLDKVEKGRIVVDDERITNKSANEVDRVRNEKIGYVFQNFNLLDDRTVYENVAMALRMVGITDEESVRKRVSYCLEELGIYQLRNRRAAALSGGQRQRVAIARAIVKNPKIIIADEPTGNLDSANTLEIMNIIRKLSENRLVILVTHERGLASFYADYVAEIKDGRIVNSYTNDSERTLDYRIDENIYLKDMPFSQNLEDNLISLDYYSDDDTCLKIKIAVVNNNIYVDTGGKYNVVDSADNVELIDDHYKVMVTDEYDAGDFRYDAFLPEGFTSRYTPLYKFSRLLGDGWRTVKGFKKITKVFMLGFVLAAMFVFLAFSNVLGIFDIQPEEYLTTNANYVTVSAAGQASEVLDLVGSLNAVDYAIPGDSKISVGIPLDDYLQTTFAETSEDVSVVSDSVLKNDELILGKMPASDHEVVLDKMVIESILESGDAEGVGVDSVEQFVGRKIGIRNLDDYTIAGVSDKVSPCMYVDESQILNILSNAEPPKNTEFIFGDEADDLLAMGKIKDIELTKSKLTIKSGKKPEKNYEVLVRSTHANEYKIGSTVPVTMGGHKLKVSGFYDSDRSGEDTMYVTAGTIAADFTDRQEVITAYADNVNLLQSMLEEKQIASVINTDRDKSNHIDSKKKVMKSSLTVAIIILLISLMEMFFMLRSSFMSRIREIGTLRAIGLKRKEIYRMFAGEILVMTAVTAIPGIALMYYIMTKAVIIADKLGGLYMISPLVALATLAVILIFNLIAGMIPVFVTVRQTPAEILARSDIS